MFYRYLKGDDKGMSESYGIKSADEVRKEQKKINVACTEKEINAVRNAVERLIRNNSNREEVGVPRRKAVDELVKQLGYKIEGSGRSDSFMLVLLEKIYRL